MPRAAARPRRSSAIPNPDDTTETAPGGTSPGEEPTTGTDQRNLITKFLVGGLTAAAAILTAFGISGGLIGQMIRNAPLQTLGWAGFVAFAVGAGLFCGLSADGVDASLHWVGFAAGATTVLAIIATLIAEVVWVDVPFDPTGLVGLSIFATVVAILAITIVIVSYAVRNKWPPQGSYKPTLLWLLAVALTSFAVGVAGLVYLGSEVSATNSRPQIAASLTRSTDGTLQLEATIRASGVRFTDSYLVCVEGQNTTADDNAQPDDATGVVPCGIQDRTQLLAYETRLNGDETGELNYSFKTKVNPTAGWDLLRIRVNRVHDKADTRQPAGLTDLCKGPLLDRSTDCLLVDFNRRLPGPVIDASLTPKDGQIEAKVHVSAQRDVTEHRPAILTIRVTPDNGPGQTLYVAKVHAGDDGVIAHDATVTVAPTSGFVSVGFALVDDTTKITDACTEGDKRVCVQLPAPSATRRATASDNP